MNRSIFFSIASCVFPAWFKAFICFWAVFNFTTRAPCSFNSLICQAEIKTLQLLTPVLKTGGTVTFTAGAATRLVITGSSTQTCTT